MSKVWTYNEVIVFKDAIRNGDVLHVALMLTQDPNLSNLPIGDYAPTTIAIQNKHADILQLLLQNGAWREGFNDFYDNQRDFTVAELINDPEILSTLIAHFGINGCILNENLLHIATRARNPHVIEWLLKEGADPNTLTQCFNDPPLFDALINLKTEDDLIGKKSIELLLAYGADVNIPVREYESVIAFAEWFCSSNSAVELLKRYSQSPIQE